MKNTYITWYLSYNKGNAEEICNWYIKHVQGFLQEYKVVFGPDSASQFFDYVSNAFYDYRTKRYEDKNTHHQHLMWGRRMKLTIYKSMYSLLTQNTNNSNFQFRTVFIERKKTHVYLSVGIFWNIL